MGVLYFFGFCLWAVLPAGGSQHFSHFLGDIFCVVSGQLCQRTDTNFLKAFDRSRTDTFQRQQGLFSGSENVTGSLYELISFILTEY